MQEDGSSVERFVEFITNAGHTGEDIFKAIESKIQKYNIDILNCRGQSYDNASNMSAGLQTKLKNVLPRSECMPCSTQSLNLVVEYREENCS